MRGVDRVERRGHNPVVERGAIGRADSAIWFDLFVVLFEDGQCHVGAQEPLEIDLCRSAFQVRTAFEQVAAAGDLRDLREAHFRQQSSHFLGDRVHVRLRVCRVTFEDFRRPGDPGRTVRNVAVLADYATHGNHQPLAESELVRTEQRVLNHVVTVLDTAADADFHALANAVDDERLVCLRQAHFARQPGMFF